MKFGEYLKFVRTKKLKITQTELSQLTGVSTAEISKIENGKTNVSAKVVSSLSSVIGEQLLFLSNEFKGNLEDKERIDSSKINLLKNEKLAIDILSKQLINKGFNILPSKLVSSSFNNNFSTNYIPDIVATDKFNNIYALDIYITSSESTFNKSDNIYYKKNKARIMLKNRISTLIFSNIDNLKSYTIAFTDKNTFNEICTINTSLITFELSFIYINLETKSIDDPITPKDLILL